MPSRDKAYFLLGSTIFKVMRKVSSQASSAVHLDTNIQIHATVPTSPFATASDDPRIVRFIGHPQLTRAIRRLMRSHPGKVQCSDQEFFAGVVEYLLTAYLANFNMIGDRIQADKAYCESEGLDLLKFWRRKISQLKFPRRKP